MRLANLMGLASGLLSVSQAQGDASGSCCAQEGRDLFYIMTDLILHAGIVCFGSRLTSGVFGQDMVSCIL